MCCPHLVHLLLHLVLLGLLDLRQLLHSVHAHARSEDLDLVRVQRRVGHEDVGVLDALRLAHADLLVQDETVLQVRILHAATNLNTHIQRTHGRTTQWTTQQERLHVSFM